MIINLEEIEKMLARRLEEIEKMLARRKEINAVRLESITWHRDGEPVSVCLDKVREWAITGFGSFEFARHELLQGHGSVTTLLLTDAPGHEDR